MNGTSSACGLRQTLRLERRTGGKADAFFARHGNKAVFLGRFVGFARTLVHFLAGTSRMPYRSFLPYNVLGAVLWASAVTLLDYFLGASWQTAGRWLGRASAVLGWVGMGVVVLLVWLWRWAVPHEAFIWPSVSRFFSASARSCAARSLCA